MRLRKLSVSTWTVLAVVDADGTCDLYDELKLLHQAKQTRATAAGFFALWQRIPSEGPRSLGTELYHQLNPEHEVYEFRKRGHRVLCFEVGGRVVLCSHVVKKSGDRIPRREIDRAIELRRQYLAADQANEVEIEE